MSSEEGKEQTKHLDFERLNNVVIEAQKNPDSFSCQKLINTVEDIFYFELKGLRPQPPTEARAFPEFDPDKHVVDLEPCPFCGSDAAIYAFNQSVLIHCTKCEIHQKSFFDPFDNKRQIEPAIKHWNHRPTANVREVLEEVLERFKHVAGDFCPASTNALETVIESIAKQLAGLGKGGV